MSIVTLFNKNYSLDNTILNLSDKNISSLPAEIGNLINLQYLYLDNNQLTSLPVEILKIKNSIYIDETGYEINNLDNENEILIFSDLSYEITNLPINTKEIWLKKKIEKVNIKAPFGCILHYF